MCTRARTFVPACGPTYVGARFVDFGILTGSSSGSRLHAVGGGGSGRGQGVENSSFLAKNKLHLRTYVVWPTE